ncbi:MAG: hypothetical protein AAF098_00865 [Pseudomonadota bacterium]
MERSLLLKILGLQCKGMLRLSEELAAALINAGTPNGMVLSPLPRSDPVLKLSFIAHEWPWIGHAK